MSTADSARLTGEQHGWPAIPGLLVQTPYLAWIGLGVQRYEPDDVATRLPFRVELSNDGSRSSTVSMALRYVAASTGGDLLCGARTVRRARRARLHRDHGVRRVGQGSRARDPDLPHRMTAPGQRRRMTFPVTSADASDAR